MYNERYKVFEQKIVHTAVHTVCVCLRVYCLRYCEHYTQSSVVGF